MEIADKVNETPASGTDRRDVAIKAESRIAINPGLIFFLALILAVFVAVHHYLEARFDFGLFYSAAHMVLDGSRHALYNFDAQRAFQERFGRDSYWPFLNPPFVLIPILAVAKLPMLAAFSIWTVVSLVLLLLSLKTLEVETEIYYGNWPILLSLAYSPVMACLIHGQFSLVVLASYVFTYSQWRKGRRFLGGAILSIATFKFQLVMGFVAVLLVKRKWRELGGFASGCTLLLALSVLITGTHALLAYPAFVLHTEIQSELSHMASYRGFLSLLGLNRGWLIVVLSIISVIWAARAWKDLDRGFAAAMLAAMLLALHLTPEDLSLTIVPIYLCVNSAILPRARFPLFVFILLFVLAVWVETGAPAALLAIPLTAALVWLGFDALRRRAEIQESSAG